MHAAWNSVSLDRRASKSSRKSVCSCRTALMCLLAAATGFVGGLLLARPSSDIGASMLPLKRSGHATGCPELSKELADQIGHNGTIILTVTNYLFLDFLKNWVHHLRAAGAENFVVGIYEEETARTLVEWGVPCMNMSGVMDLVPGGGFGYHEANWAKVAWSRVAVIPEFLRWGYSVIWSDLDVVWFRNPTELVTDYPGVDMVMGTDQVATILPKGDGYFERPKFAFEYQFNAGTIMVRAGVRAVLDVMDAWKGERDAGRKERGQDALNYELVRAGVTRASQLEDHLVPGDDRIWMAYRDRVRFASLPASTALTGRTYSLQRLDKRWEVSPWCYHQTWIYGGRGGKRGRLEEALLWHGELPGSKRYSGDGRYLTIDMVQPQIPFDSQGTKFVDWNGKEPLMQAYHLAAIDFQLSQLYYGFVLALTLNRILILPKMACFCDHNWQKPVNCRTPLTNMNDFPLPYACPFDFLFHPERWAAEDPERGSSVSYRHHTFLSDRSLDPHVKASQVLVQTSDRASCGDGGCNESHVRDCQPAARISGPGLSGSTISVDGQEQPMPTKCIPRGVQQSQLPQLLQPLDNVRVLHFADAPRVWGGWSDDQVRQQAERRMQSALVRWELRREEQAKELNRNTTEAYNMSPFSDVEQLYAKALDGSIDVARILRERRADPWEVNGDEFEFRDQHASAALWPASAE